MRLALIGYGKMGQTIATLAKDRGHQIAAIIDPSHSNATHSILTPSALNDAEVCLDFTRPDAVLKNAKIVISAGKALVIGTTGWSHHVEAIQQLVENHGVGVLYGSNFCIGVHLFLQIAREAARLIEPHCHYDVAVVETHHRQKVDSPSGTAKRLAETLLESLTRKSKIQCNRMDRPRDPEEIPITSIRAGSFPGTHTVLLDSTCDTIEITHTARSRDGFAEGAIQAAEWIANRRGLFTFEELLAKSIYCGAEVDSSCNTCQRSDR